MRLEARALLFDMDRSGRLLEAFLEGKTFEDYLGSALLRSAVERQFEIIGEALGKLARENPDIAARISDYRRIIAFRNRLIHGYASVSDEVVWGVIETSLPILRQEVAALLEGAGKE